MKKGKVTIYTEFLAVALLLTFFAYRFWRLHPLVALLIFVLSYGCCYWLLEKNRHFRTAVSAAAVLGWSALAFFGSKWVGHVSDATAWVFAMLVFLVAVLGYTEVLVFRRYK